MSAEMVAVWPLLDRMQARARLLEKEAVALRTDIVQIIQALESPVAAYVVDGEELIITEQDSMAVKTRLTRPRSDEVVQALALADKIASLRRPLPLQVRERLFWENVEAMRTQAVADGVEAFPAQPRTFASNPTAAAMKRAALTHITA